MLDRIAQWAALDLTGVVALPVWAIAAALAIAVLVAMLALMRAGADGRSLPAAVLVLIAVVGACWWVGDYLARRDRAAEQRVLDARVFELATRAFMPGSALGCLDPLVAETMEDTCEKTIFASPEATAAAISYVAAQLAVLGSAGEHAADPGMLALRRALEADRFGIVAHVLAVGHGCTPEQCPAFALLHDASRVRLNMAGRSYDTIVNRHMAAWPAAGSPAVAANAPPAVAEAPANAPLAGVKLPNNLFLPSSSSIPAVSIMNAEPTGSPHDTTGSTQAPTPTLPRKPQAQARPQGNSPAAARPAPAAPAPSGQ